MTGSGAVKGSKYRSEKVVVDGETFDSKKEFSRWTQLKIMERAGVIHDLKRQVAFELQPAVKLDGERRKKPAMRYFADFVYIQDGERVVEDVKSEATRRLPAYRTKKHLMATVHSINIRET